MDDEFLHNIVKVAVDPRGDSNAMTKFIVNNKTDAGKTDINLFFYDNKLSNCPLSLVDASHQLYQFVCLSAF